MLLKLLLKIWPSLVPILSYVFWVIIQRIIRNYFEKKQYIDGEFEELDKDGKKVKRKLEQIPPFSLKNRNFIIVIYLSLVLMILSFLYFALAK